MPQAEVKIPSLFKQQLKSQAFLIFDKSAAPPCDNLMRLCCTAAPAVLKYSVFFSIYTSLSNIHIGVASRRWWEPSRKEKKSCFLSIFRRKVLRAARPPRPQSVPRPLAKNPRLPPLSRRGAVDREPECYKKKKKRTTPSETTSSQDETYRCSQSVGKCLVPLGNDHGEDKGESHPLLWSQHNVVGSQAVKR